MKFKLNNLNKNRGDSSVQADDTVSVSYLETENNSKELEEHKLLQIDDYSPKQIRNLRYKGTIKGSPNRDQGILPESCSSSSD